MHNTIPNRSPSVLREVSHKSFDIGEDSGVAVAETLRELVANRNTRGQSVQSSVPLVARHAWCERLPAVRADRRFGCLAGPLERLREQRPQRLIGTFIQNKELKTVDVGKSEVSRCSIQ